MKRNNEMIERFENESMDLLESQTTEIFGRLVELFAEMKEVQPHLKRLHIGMGCYSIDGDFITEYDDYKDESNTDEIIEELEDNMVLYRGLSKDNDISEQINDLINNNASYVFSCENYLNDACYEFVELCNYVQ
jgi:hypothetical protein